MAFKLYTYLDEDGRIKSVTNADLHDGAIEFDYPDDFDVMTVGDYRIVEGKLEYTGEATAARKEAEKKAQAEAEERERLDSASRDYFIDGGKTKMEQDIRDAAASGGGADPQLKVFATLQIATMDFSVTPCDTVAKFIDLWPEWQPDTKYKQNAPLTYQGRKFRASRDLTSQAIYPPGTAESEYYEVKLAADGIIIWYQPGGAYNQVCKGERRHYPDADGPVYEALEDTVYSPDAYPQHWKLDGEGGGSEEPEEPGGETYPEWVQPTGAHDAYSKGAKVSHNGKNWVSDTDSNVWEPGVYGWTEE